MLVRLTFARWMRCAGVWLRSVLLIFLLIWLTETVAGSILTRAEATRQLLQSTPIRCVLATKDGRTEDVSIMNGLVYSFVQGGAKQFVSEFAVRTEKTMTLPDGSPGMITGVTNPVASLVLRLGLTLVVLVGAYRVHDGVMEPGVIVAFLQYFTMILNAMLGVTRVFVMWSKGEASAKRIARVLDTEEDLQVLPLEEAVPEEAPHIEFENVTFSYTGVGTNLENLSFRLNRGQTLGILGPTGSGKSTILNLLLRLYDPDSGTVRIDGQDIRTIPYETLRKKFGVVFQNDFITEGTIGHNIRFFREIGHKAVEAAAKNAQAHFIEEKEGGMEAEVVVRGNNLSGGQKQRLLIARALAADPEILVLDDASSALDYATDAALRQALRQNHRHTTTVVVAQRISSLRHADLILVLQDGQVIGAGNHEALMESCQEYRIIAHTQMGDGKEGA